MHFSLYPYSTLRPTSAPIAPTALTGTTTPSHTSAATSTASRHTTADIFPFSLLPVSLTSVTNERSIQH